MFGKKTSYEDRAKLSLLESRTVCGYTIRKMPIKPYLEALEKLKDAPADFMEACFPGKTAGEALDSLAMLDKSGFAELLAGVATGLPDYAIGLVADLTGIDKDHLLNDPEIGLDGLVEIVNVFIEVNRLGKFLREAAALKAKLFNAATKTSGTGSSD